MANKSDTKTDTNAGAKSAAAANPHYATRDFKDAGTTRFFERGAEITEASEGELGNYRAAGLISTEKPQDPADAEKAALDAALG